MFINTVYTNLFTGSVWNPVNAALIGRERNHIAAAMLVWLSVKELADKTKKTVYQLKQGLLSDYLIQQMRNPTIAFS